MTETIKIQVRVKIQYDENNKSGRKEVIKIAKQNVLSCSSFGGDYYAETLTAKLLK